MRLFPLFVLIFMTACNKTGFSPSLSSANPYLFVAGGATSKLGGCVISPTTGLLTPFAGGAVTVPCAAGACGEIAVDSLRNYVFISDQSGNIFLYNFNSSTQTLTYLATSAAPFNNGFGRFSIFPNSGIIFGYNSSGSISVFNYSGGSFTRVYGSPFYGAAGGTALIGDSQEVFAWNGGAIFTHSGTFVFDTSANTAINWNQGSYHWAQNSSGNLLYASTLGAISIYSINRLNGNLTLLNTYTPPVECDGMAIDPGGDFLFSLDQSTPAMTTYLIGSGGTSLTQLATTGTNSGINFVATNMRGSYVYLPIQGANNVVNTYKVDPSSGTLTLVNGVTCGTAGVITKVGYF